jgi:Domain of unknown function (DUF5979)/Thioester domain
MRVGACGFVVGFAMRRVAVVVAVGVLFLSPASAHAVWTPGTPAGPALRGAPLTTEMTMSGTAEGHGVSGFAPTAFDPKAAPGHYPTSNPSSGYTLQPEWFAGIILGTPTGGGSPLRLYCIDLNTLTDHDYGYGLGNWSDANVPNVGYIARILDEYYPNTTGEPRTLHDVNDRAAAVQAAIWFFSDGYVLDTADPVHDAAAAIVESVLSSGPLTKPPPSLTITPSTKTGLADEAIGPFVVKSSAPHTTVSADASMFSDATATTQIQNGASVSPDTTIYLKSTSIGTATLTATATATVPSGNVYLYSGNIPNRSAAQKLILAQTTELTTSAHANATFEAFGSLKVEKTITGAAAGNRGPVTITVTCDKGDSLPPFTIDASKPAGTQPPQVYERIPAGAQCTVTETANGQTDKAQVDIAPSGGQSVTVQANDTVTASMTDTYNVPAPGSLIVNKSITGPAAGQQGRIRIHVVCDGTPDTLTPDWVIPAGASGQLTPHTYGNIPSGAICTVSELVDGSTSSVSVKVSGNGTQVSVRSGSAATVDLTNEVMPLPGSLVVQKSIGGDAAGH